LALNDPHQYLIKNRPRKVNELYKTFRPIPSYNFPGWSQLSAAEFRAIPRGAEPHFIENHMLGAKTQRNEFKDRENAKPPK
jgi:hypothetical protein